MAQSPAPDTRLISSSAIVLDSRQQRVYVADTIHNRVLYTGAGPNEVGSITVERSPDALALDPAIHRLYVVNSGSGTVSVIDTGSNQVLTELKTDAHPYTLIVDSKLHLVYVANTFSNELTVINGLTNVITRRSLGSKDALAVDETRGRIYLSSYEDDRVLMIDEVSGGITHLPAVPHVWALAVDPQTGLLYAAAIGSNQVLIINADGRRSGTVHVGRMPAALAVDSFLHRLYVANREDNTISILNTQSNRLIATVAVGARPAALALDSVHHLLYVANTLASSISVLTEGSHAKVIATLPVSGPPFDLVSNPQNSRLTTATFGKEAFDDLELLPMSRVVH